MCYFKTSMGMSKFLGAGKDGHTATKSTECPMEVTCGLPIRGCQSD